MVFLSQLLTRQVAVRWPGSACFLLLGWYKHISKPLTWYIAVCLKREYKSIFFPLWRKAKQELFVLEDRYLYGIDYCYSCCYSILLKVGYILTSKKESRSLCSSQVTCHCFHTLYTSFLCLSLARSSMFIYASLSSLLPDFILVEMDDSWPWRKWRLNINHLSLVPEGCTNCCIC